MRPGSLAAQLFAGTSTALGICAPALAPATKPNFAVIIGDEIGMWNIGPCHRDLVAGRAHNARPNEAKSSS